MNKYPITTTEIRRLNKQEAVRWNRIEARLWEPIVDEIIRILDAEAKK